ncbi:hypothetical protein [Pontiella agarivorans]|uniref:Uncharacterized protein n=1 Tax=Pontiella agarivorans TaxID=3038953 RepID=A0ABU5MWF0_9BACT|nr:hypothetical protein [Pontiella agarivorans]MDZ8118538.1 hypothetical protein [Pontiella agarivorans]
MRLIILIMAVLSLKGFAEQIDKPWGCYCSMLTERAAVDHPELRGGLVRATWARLEPEPGRFDFSEIERQLRLLPKGKNWSLAVYAGWTSVESDSAVELKRPLNRPQRSRPPMASHTPEWMVSEMKVQTFACPFRGYMTTMPKYWDPVVQQRLKMLMQALAENYKTDERLKLVYVPQMTGNGIEGHFNGVPHSTLLSVAGLSSGDEEQFASIWTEASLTAIRSTARAFDNKAVAFEVHELLGSRAVPEKIMAEIINDPMLENQVGIGMWWISGKSTYQPDLLELIEKFPGDLYGQVIGRSDQARRFPDGDYASVFTQAEQLGMRYIEVWNYEFEHRTHDQLLEAFNQHCRKLSAGSGE